MAIFAQARQGAGAIHRSLQTGRQAFRPRNITMGPRLMHVVTMHSQSQELENAPRCSFSRSHRSFSDTTLLQEGKPEMVDLSDELEAETKRIINLFKTQNHESAMIEQKTIDAIMQRWVERAPLEKWGRRAPEIALELLESLEQSTLTPDTAVYNFVLQAYALCFRWDNDKSKDTAEAASRLLDRMMAKCRETAQLEVRSPAPTTRTFNVVLNAWARSHSADAGERAEQVFRKMEEWLLECRHLSLPEASPDGRTLCAVMDAWVKSGVTGAADRVSAMLDVAIDRQKRAVQGDHASREGVVMKPDVVMFNTAIQAWGTRRNVGVSTQYASGKADHGARKAEQLLQLMMILNESGDLGGRNEHDENDAGLAPTTRSFNMVLNAWTEACRDDRSGDSAERAEQVLNDMIKQYQGTGVSVKPDARSFTTCIRAWARSTGHPNFALRAQDVYDRMTHLYRLSQDDDIKPDSNAGNALIAAWAKSIVDDSAERAARAFEDMKEFFEPDVYTYNALIDAYVRKGDVWKAYETLTKLENSTSVKPDIVSYNSTLQALSKESSGAPEAQKLLDRMIADENVAPDRISYTCVINAWGNNKFGHENGAHRAAILFDRMQQAYKQGNVRLKPDVIAFTSAIHASANVKGNADDKRAALRFAISTFELLKENPQFGKPNHLTYHAIIRACSRLALSGEERTRVLEDVFQQCIEKGMVSRQVLDMFVNGVTFRVQQNYSINPRNPAVPEAWCINVRNSDRPQIR